MTEQGNNQEPVREPLNELLEEDRRELQPTLDALAGWARRAAERPEGFWDHQRTAVGRRIDARKKRMARGLGALAAAVCLALIALAISGAKRHAPKVPLRAQDQPDQELMLRVERTVESDGPRALAPAALLAQEISQQTGSAPTDGDSNRGDKQ